ncbi:hypothetical protein [Streptomyces sediminimaris]|uniref:hypothetical protein n=1 Tax=Streptomyces sediminimaris TaxID=3383721 RepID=UPI003999A5E6
MRAGSRTGGGGDGSRAGRRGRARIEVREVVHGQRQALRRWLQLDDGRRPLTILSADAGELREHTPGELAARVGEAGDPDRAARTALWLSSWLYRRAADAPQQQVLDWVAAAAAWAWHMHVLADAPPSGVLADALNRGQANRTRPPRTSSPVPAPASPGSCGACRSAPGREAT